MKLTVLHSWKNKTLIDHIAHFISKDYEINLQYSEESIKNSPIGLVLWSKHTKNLPQLNEYLALFEKHNTTLLFATIDQTPLPKHLSKKPTIKLQNKRQLVLKKWPEEIQPLANSIIKVFSNKEHSRATTKGVGPFINQIKRKIHAANKDLRMLANILMEVIQNEFKYPQEMRLLRFEIENIISTIESATFTQDIDIPSYYIKDFVKWIEDDEQNGKLDIKMIVRNFVKKKELNEAVDFIYQYIYTSAKHLKTINRTLSSSNHTELHIIMDNLVSYIHESEDLFPDSQYGYLGYIDDAWLINNLLYRLIESAHLKEQALQMDIEQLFMTDELIRNILPSQVLYQLEGMMLQFMQIMVRSNEDYHPVFMRNPNNYHAYMSPSSEETDPHFHLRANKKEYFKGYKRVSSSYDDEQFFGHK